VIAAPDDAPPGRRTIARPHEAKTASTACGTARILGTSPGGSPASSNKLSPVGDQPDLRASQLTSRAASSDCQFRWLFHLALRRPSGAHWLDGPPGLTSQDSTRQHASDGPLLSCKQLVGVPSPRQLPKVQVTAYLGLIWRRLGKGMSFLRRLSRRRRTSPATLPRCTGRHPTGAVLGTRVGLGTGKLHRGSATRRCRWCHTEAAFDAGWR
jgi:hypothetical protein